jgi:hypothetical protein
VIAPSVKTGLLEKEKTRTTNLHENEHQILRMNFMKVCEVLGSLSPLSLISRKRP